LPATVALDAQGRIRAIIRGYLHGKTDLERLGVPRGERVNNACDPGNGDTAPASDAMAA